MVDSEPVQVGDSVIIPLLFGAPQATGVVAFQEIIDLDTPDGHEASPRTPFQMLQATPDSVPYVWQREHLPDSASMFELVSRFVQASLAIQAGLKEPGFQASL